MLQDHDGNLVEGMPAPSQSTDLESGPPSVGTPREAEMPAEPESYAVATPRREGVIARIEVLETESKAVSLRRRRAGEQLVTQGDILRDVEFVEDVFEDGDGLLHVPRIRFPHVIVLTQACDLEHGTCLLSVLVAPLHNAEHLFNGAHLGELGLPAERIKKDGTRGRNIAQNSEPRFHYLRFPDGVQLPDLIIDFRQYCSLNVDYLTGVKSTRLAWTVPPLWRDHISQRFAAFLARIGLPQPTPPADLARMREALEWPRRASRHTDKV